MFSNLSIQLLNECHRTNEDATYRLVSCYMEEWGGESCFRIMNLLDLQVEPENSELITHSSFQDVLSSFWNGDLDTRNSQVKLFYLRPLLVRTF